MQKTILKTVDRKTTVSREAISGAFAVARSITKPGGVAAKKTIKKNTVT